MAAHSPPSPTAQQLPPIPSSPTYSYASTANPLSQYSLPPPPPPRPAHAVLTKADLEHSQAAYADLLASAKAYRLALASLSTAASSFGSALESCARLKEARADALLAPPPSSSAPMSMSNSFTAHAGGLPTSSSPSSTSSCTADTLLTVAGLQHLVANHQHILSETVYRAFEVPLLHELDKWRGAVEDEEERYARAAAAQAKEIRRMEKEGLKMHRQARRRDVGAFRNHLVELTAMLDGLTVLHGEHARTLLRESQETSARIVEASCSLVRAEVDIFESLARKGWTGGGLEEVLEKGTDLFAAEMDPGGLGKAGGGTGLFSILPPKSILADTSGADTIRGGKDTRSDSLLVDTDRYQSLAGAVSSRGRDRDTDSIFSEFNRSRNVRPFSPQPQPLRLNPEDLLGPLENGTTAESSLSGSGRGGRHDQGGMPGRDEGRAVEDDHEDDAEAHPWRDEGLRRGTPSDDESESKVGVSLGGQQQRDETWSVADGDT
ncbi:hypothetical protein N657DRAFT_570290 [Parathielavia appendiculata]|uniref:Phospholipid-binding protein n=1 Tax=Parathielavia appendiculata TaxID=2587402 RepID=A0AAN6U229_9PEZI|nr:hypothetical protein N657DRAFT_570290 [Parathielavia appendiculata]